MSVEKIIYTKEFEQILPHEIERKFLAIEPEMLSCYREQSKPIEQAYLSHPEEPFTLRLRADYDECNNPRYIAALKDTGTLTEKGLERLEVEAPIDESTYQNYLQPDIPIIRKLRAEPLPGVTIDYYENGAVLIESENPESWSKFSALHDDMFVEVSGDKQSDNEWLAHLEFRRANNGTETLKPGQELAPQDIANDILRQRALGHIPTVVHIGGRSGSGKSTIVKDLRTELEAFGLTSVVVSTDDYHRGEAWLVEHNGGKPWTKWDDAVVYDTNTMANDLATLLSGQPIARRGINWKTVAPEIQGTIEPSDVIIIEGIYARAAEITFENDLEYEMTTGFATCVGRRLLRDIVERPEFADPVKSLRYMIEEAEPAYRKQEELRR